MPVVHHVGVISSQLDLMQNNNGILMCVRVKFPDHPQLLHRKSCGTELLKSQIISMKNIEQTTTSL